MSSKFSKRSEEAELMDDLECSGTVVDQTLRELETINKWLGGNQVTIDGLNQLWKALPEGADSITIADIGCGGGDMLKLIAQWARKKKIKALLTGIDANPNIIKYAEKNTVGYPEITYQTLDIFSEEFKAQRFDIVTSTLFTHHFSDQQLSKLFNQLCNQTNIGIVINDLHRHWFAFHSIKWITRLFSKSEMVKNDATVSVMRSFHKKELDQILIKAGISNFSLRWMWAFRWQLVFRST